MMPRCLDRLAQVFDSGLLGEGALHIIAAARERGLLSEGATILPCKAKVLGSGGLGWVQQARHPA